MQMAVVDYARHVVGMDGANSAEFDPETPLPGRRPAPGAEGGHRPRRHDAPRRRPGEAPRGHQGARDLRRRGRHLQAPPSPLRGQQHAAPPDRGRRPRDERHLARRAPRRDRRAARPPLLRRLPVPPGVQLPPDPARAALPRVHRRRQQAARRAARARRVDERDELRRVATAEISIVERPSHDWRLA